MAVSMFKTRMMLAMLETLHPPRTFLLDTFFRNVELSTTKYVDIDIYTGKRRLAPMVNPTLEGKPVDRVGFTTKTLEPPYVKPKMVFTAADLGDRMPGQHMYEATGGPSDHAREQLAKDMSEMQDMITRREEWMAAQILNGGVLTLTGEGVNETLDFGMAANHKITLSGPDLWTDSASNPIADLMAWRRRCSQDSGLMPNRSVFGSGVVDAFLANAEVKEQLDTRRAELGQLRVQELPDGVTYVGSLFQGGLDIFAYDEWYISEADGLEYPMVPANKVFLGSTRARTARHYGRIQDVRAPARTRWFPTSWTTEDPVARWVMLQSSPLVAMHQPDAFLVAQPIA